MQIEAHDNKPIASYHTSGDVVNIWCSIANQYSFCDLTFEIDKFVAIAGLAKAISAIIDDTYVAGKWQNTLYYELGWSAMNSREAGRPKKYLAPSWSRFSIKAQIMYRPVRRFANLQTLVNVVSIHVQPVTRDTWG